MLSRSGVAAAATLAPWTIRNRAVTGHWVPTTLWVGPSLYDGLSETATGESDMRFFDRDQLLSRMSEYDMDREYRRRAWEFVRENPGRSIELAFAKLWRYLRPWPGADQFSSPAAQVLVAGYSIPVMLLSIVGVWVLRKDLWFVALAAAPFVLFAIVHCVFVSSLRYRLPAEYPISLLAAAGLQSLIDRKSKKSRVIPRALRLTLTVLGGLALIGGAGAWYVWVNGDAYARDELHRRLAELAPSCQIELGKTRFDWDRSLTVRDFAMGSKRRGESPTLSVPEAIIEVDRERLVNDHEVEVTSIRLIRPQLDLVRRADGSWAINELMPFHLNDIPLPEWKIEEGTLRFILERPAGDPLVLLLRDANLRLVPADGKRLIVKGLGDVSDAGQMQVSGEIDLEQGTWSLSGTMKGVSTAGDIAGFAMSSSQGLRDKVASLGEQLRETEGRLLAEREDRARCLAERGTTSHRQSNS